MNKKKWIVYEQAKYVYPEKMKDKIDEYFDYIEENKIAPTVSGLSAFLGFGSRISLYDYKKKPKFEVLINSAINYIEILAETQLLDGTSTRGTMYWLNNHGWSENQKIELKADVKNDNTNINVSADISKMETDDIDTLMRILNKYESSTDI